jgi:hypothetical protein
VNLALATSQIRAWYPHAIKAGVMTFADAAGGWAVVGIVLGAVAITEGITYLAVYRKPSYLRLCKSVEELSRKCTISFHRLRNPMSS